MCYVRSSVKGFAKSGSVANRHAHMCRVLQSEGGAAGSLVVFVASPYVAAQPSPPVYESAANVASTLVKGEHQWGAVLK